jgi:hypothetical protein
VLGKRSLRHWLGVTLVIASLMAVAGAASAAPSHAATAPQVRPNQVNQLDCNGYSATYQSIRPSEKMDCTDPMQTRTVTYDGKKVIRGYRFDDNGHYVGHDEPSVKFISHAAGSGNAMTYFVKLPADPRLRPTATGGVTDYAELSLAPWFGLPLCDPASYPQNPCTPDSDRNSGSASDPNAAGSAFMELQLYPPGYTPFADNISCSRTKWCGALTIDSLECNFNFAFCNPDCEEPLNAAFLQSNGVPTGPPSPQLADISSLTPNARTLLMSPGDVLKVSIGDPAAGLTTSITDLTTGRSGFMVASARNGFMNTDLSTCAGMAHTFHAEYNTARKQNQVPWAALEGGVLMTQEIGHFEPCNAVAHRLAINVDDGAFLDRDAFQTCLGGIEGRRAVGEGPCNPTTGICKNSTTEGTTGPIACPTKDSASGQLCEFSDAPCFPKGTRVVVVNGQPRRQHAPVAGCTSLTFQNGDLDWDGTSYQKRTWPNGRATQPTAFRYLGPFDARGRPYPKIQFETNAPDSEFLCNTTTGLNCDVKPLGSEFYPFWSLSNTRRPGAGPAPDRACVWNFGNVLPGVTKQTFGRDKQYGEPNLERFGGTSISAVMANPAVTGRCPAFRIS